MRKSTTPKNKCIFYTCLGIVWGILAVQLSLYFREFQGPLSSDISDWANFTTFATGFVTMLFSGLSVWVMFNIETTMLDNDQYNHDLELKFRMVNSFEHWLYTFFTPDEDTGSATFVSQKLVQSLDYLKRLQIYEQYMPFLKSVEYKSYIDMFAKFAKDIHFDTPEIWGNATPEQEAYRLYSEGRHILEELTKNLITNKTY